MNKREMIEAVLAGEVVPYVPWELAFTLEAEEKLKAHFGAEQLNRELDNHMLRLNSTNGGPFVPLGDERYRDPFGVVWNRTEDKDIGIVEGQVLPEPSLEGFRLPDPLSERNFAGIPELIQAEPDKFRVFGLGFSLFERAWTLRGMEDLLMDMIVNPEFVRDLLRWLADYNIAVVTEAMTRFEVDAIYFGDDWGQQHGLIMGPELWREFLFPELKRMYGAVKARGKRVYIHSCGDVDELFDSLIEIGLDCFNPFQPEVMDIYQLMRQYRGRLTFHGGMSTQRTLPYGTPAEVRAETARLLEAGRGGNYIFAPAHAVESDVPLENILAFLEVLKSQPGCR